MVALWYGIGSDAVLTSALHDVKEASVNVAVEPSRRMAPPYCNDGSQDAAKMAMDQRRRIDRATHTKCPSTQSSIQMVQCIPIGTQY